MKRRRPKKEPARHRHCSEILENHFALMKQEPMLVVLSVEQRRRTIAHAEAIAPLSAVRMRHLDVTPIARCIMLEITNLFWTQLSQRFADAPSLPLCESPANHPLNLHFCLLRIRHEILRRL